jgi:hypothetical protein
MNPFTRHLLGGGKQENEALAAFIERWDALEALVIRVFRNKGAETADQTEYQQLRLWLLENYSVWQEQWQPFWQETMAGGLPAKEDPFQRLLKAEEAADFVGDWEALQYLPAARETINRYIQLNY